MENENKRLHEWFGLGCYHRWKREVEGAVAEADNVCVDCGQPHTDYSYGGWGVDKSHTRPRYDEESGFFALLSGLRAKGFGWTMTGLEDDGLMQVTLYGESVYGPFWAVSTSLPLALFQAAIKAMDAETSDAREQGGDAP